MPGCFGISVYADTTDRATARGLLDDYLADHPTVTDGTYDYDFRGTQLHLVGVQEHAELDDTEGAVGPGLSWALEMAVPSQDHTDMQAVDEQINPLCLAVDSGSY
jgi:hypothetical protein